MNRINAFFLIFLSFLLSFLVVYKYIDSKIKREPERISVPLRIEVYRADRNPLPDADIYLNQKFIGRTDNNGLFSKNIELVVGQKYTIRIEKDRDGYFYGPWETHFVPAAKSEGKNQKIRLKQENKSEEMENVNNLEGESDILTEIQRAKLGIASIYERYHFLAILPGYMFYRIKVLSHEGKVIESADVIINDKVEGKTDKNGEFLVKYEGKSIREEKIEISKEGEHLWIDKVQVKPNAVITIELNKMLIIDLYVLTESYDVIKGISGSQVFIKNELMGVTKSDGFIEFKYRNEKGVDGYLKIKIKFPSGYMPRYATHTFFIKKSLPKLIIHSFANSKYPPKPKVSVLPFNVKDKSKDAAFLQRNALFLTRRVEDYLRSNRIYQLVSADKTVKLFNQFDIKLGENVSWKDIPILKKAVDSIIIGDLKKSGKYININVKAINYDGILVIKKESKVLLREIKRLAEDIAKDFMRRFQIEGTIVSISKNVYINLGSRQGVQKGDIFYGYKNYFDNSTNKYERKRVVKLKVIENSSNVSACEVENILEGYLLEPGVKVKRSREIISKQGLVNVKLKVTEEGKPVTNANVYVDEKWKGQTDNSGMISFKATSYTDLDVLIYKDGYIPFRDEIKVEDRNKTIEIKMKRGVCRLYIDSSPQGAIVHIDGRYIGVTPIDREPIVLNYGFHLVEVEMEGYRPYREYLKLSSPKMNLIGDRKIILYRDYYSKAEAYYEEGKIDLVIDTLKKIKSDHPDYLKALNFLGYIYLNDKKDFTASIEYYNKYLKYSEKLGKTEPLIFVYYNLGQAYFNLAEKFYYTDENFVLQNYKNAILNFMVVKNKNYLLPKKEKKKTFINSLFYIAVSYQKVYYLTANTDFLLRAYNSWVDYFDFFDENLLVIEFYKKQYKIAKSYFDEIERIKSSEK